MKGLGFLANFGSPLKWIGASCPTWSLALLKERQSIGRRSFHQTPNFAVPWVPKIAIFSRNNWSSARTWTLPTVFEWLKNREHPSMTTHDENWEGLAELIRQPRCSDSVEGAESTMRWQLQLVRAVSGVNCCPLRSLFPNSLLRPLTVGVGRLTVWCKVWSHKTEGARCDEEIHPNDIINCAGSS